MEILHFKDLGDTSVISECSSGVNLVIDNFVMQLQILYLCIKFESNRTITMEILHFEDLGDTSVVSECSLGVNLVIDNFFIFM